VSALANRKVSRGQRSISTRPLFSVFYTGTDTFSFKCILSFLNEADGPQSIPTSRVGIEPRTSGSVSRNSDHKMTSDMSKMQASILYNPTVSHIRYS
jgi:hypothetical protein